MKKGIDAQKIQRDKEAFINMVTNGASKDKLTKYQQYLVGNIEDLAAAVSKEVDFENEMEAAIKLKKSTKLADVVVPIEAKQGVYIMEKAPGISLDTLVRYYRNETEINLYNRKLKAGIISPSEAEKEIAECRANIRLLKAKSPDFNDFDLTTDQIKTLMNKYIDIYVEQFTKMDKHGKTLHADIHPGNIFINLDALKSGKGKLFTLIDTGNTIDLTREQAIDAIKLTSFIKNGNVKDITRCVLSGVILPPSMTQEQATKLVEADLRKIFFDDKTKINPISIEELFEVTNNVLKEHGIIPNDKQLNLNKAQMTAKTSLGGLLESFFGKKYSSKEMNTKSEKMKQIPNVFVDLGLFTQKLLGAEAIQESINLSQMSFREIINLFRNPNMLKTNSEEYFTYKFKQDIKMDSNGKISINL